MQYPGCSPFNEAFHMHGPRDLAGPSIQPMARPMIFEDPLRRRDEFKPIDTPALSKYTPPSFTPVLPKYTPPPFEPLIPLSMLKLDLDLPKYTPPPLALPVVNDLDFLKSSLPRTSYSSMAKRLRDKEPWEL